MRISLKMNLGFAAIVLAVGAAAMAEEYRSIVTDFGDHWTHGPHWEKKVNDVWVQVQEDTDYPKDCEDSAWIRGGYAITIICPGGQCTLAVTCGQILVDAGGVVWMEGGNDLTLCDLDTSVVHGEIGMTCVALEPESEEDCLTSTIYIEGEVTIEGNGGFITTGAQDNEHGAAPLDIAGDDDRLNIAGATPGNTSTSMSIIARYDVIDIQVAFGNSGDVVAETSVDDEPGIKLSGEPKGGTGGYYRAKQGPAGYGNIEVYSLMSGTGDFHILDGGCGVLIDQYISCYGGDFQLIRGTLEFRKRVCTSGKFHAGHDGSSDDAYLIVKKATSGPPTAFQYGWDCGCQ